MDKNSNVVNLNSFDASDFRVPASDSKGHSVPKSFRVMPILSHAISVMMTSKAFPYKTEAELIRHAIMRHLHWLEKIGDVKSVTGQVEAANVVLREELLFEEYQETFTSLRGRVINLISRGDNQEARRIVMRMRSYFNDMPEGYWKTQYEKQLKEWDYLFDNAPKVGLSNLSPG